jgi:hypothetical protein
MDIKPQIIIENYQGTHNSDPNVKDRLIQGNTYRDSSTICIVPSRGMIPAKVVQNWMGLMPLMNQKFIRIFMIGLEVGEAYSQAIDMILAHPDLSTWKYILTLEEDNMPPPDGFIKLIESINKGYDAVGGLYWTKGPGGQPMCYGDPTIMPRNFMPQIPQPEALQPCNGLGMGFTLFKLSMFKDTRLPRPLFKTMSEYTPGVGCQVFTQDLYFFNNALALGYKFASDNRVKVGHYSPEEDIVW